MIVYLKKADERRMILMMVKNMAKEILKMTMKPMIKRKTMRKNDET